jgi:hypothetical protein
VRAALAVLSVAGTPAVADTELLAFMGGQGCTFGPASRAAAEATGFSADTIGALVAQSLSDGTAVQQGEYVVLGEAVCTIRLPDIRSAYSVSSPEIAAITSAVDAHASDGMPGCFVVGASELFDKMNGGVPGAGFSEHIAFIAAGLMAGDLRFYSPSILQTPIAFQSLAGACAEVPDIPVLRDSHVALTTGFGEYVRALGAAMPCAGASSGDLPFEQSVMARFTATIQGVDPNVPLEDQPRINAWLWYEYDLIGMAAGWHEGMTGTDRGTPRPPLCHYDEATG